MTVIAFILIIVINDNVISANPAFADIMGTSRHLIKGKFCQDVLHFKESSEKAVSDSRKEFLKTIANGKKLTRRFEVTSLEGKDIVIETNNSPLKNIEGETIGSVISVRDVSKEAEVDRMKNEFISTVSHELRTPLTSIKGYIDLILSGDTGEINDLQKEFLDIVYQNSDRLNNLINDLLDVEKIESWKKIIIKMQKSFKSLD